MTQLFKRRRFVFGTVALLLMATTQAAALDRPPSQVLVEAAWARPYGELAQDYTETVLGFGAGDGLELGFRWRYHFSRSVSLSPAFHFLDYRNFKSTNEAVGDFRISASSLTIFGRPNTFTHFNSFATRVNSERNGCDVERF